MENAIHWGLYSDTLFSSEDIRCQCIIGNHGSDCSRSVTDQLTSYNISYIFSPFIKRKGQGKISFCYDEKKAWPFQTIYDRMLSSQNIVLRVF